MKKIFCAVLVVIGFYQSNIASASACSPDGQYHLRSADGKAFLKISNERAERSIVLQFNQIDEVFKVEKSPKGNGILITLKNAKGVKDDRYPDIVFDCEKRILTYQPTQDIFRMQWVPDAKPELKPLSTQSKVLSGSGYSKITSVKEFNVMALGYLIGRPSDQQLAFALFPSVQRISNVFDRQDAIKSRAAEARALISSGLKIKGISWEGELTNSGGTLAEFIDHYDQVSGTFKIRKDFKFMLINLPLKDEPNSPMETVSMQIEVAPALSGTFKPASIDEAKLIERRLADGGVTYRGYAQPIETILIKDGGDGKLVVRILLNALDLIDGKTKKVILSLGVK